MGEHSYQQAVSGFEEIKPGQVPWARGFDRSQFARFLVVCSLRDWWSGRDGALVLFTRVIPGPEKGLVAVKLTPLSEDCFKR